MTKVKGFPFKRLFSISLELRVLFIWRLTQISANNNLWKAEISFFCIVQFLLQENEKFKAVRYCFVRFCLSACSSIISRERVDLGACWEKGSRFKNRGMFKWFHIFINMSGIISLLDLMVFLKMFINQNRIVVCFIDNCSLEYNGVMKMFCLLYILGNNVWHNSNHYYQI